jgi:membrane fusion protein, multidrug efflux system
VIRVRPGNVVNPVPFKPSAEGPPAEAGKQ